MFWDQTVHIFLSCLLVGFVSESTYTQLVMILEDFSMMIHFTPFFV